ncbi:GNAT family N-acetyltransferase [Serratia sp. arafor3]|uniref:GNAT family N-acetyltransferase n=1 Tax=Serratia silvae TaxID=2824122 RepID=A0ABT0KE15_9GAMM|nr:GNAT family N-acetyltransferase [Serratia silvae]
MEDFDRSTTGEEIWVAEQDGRLLGFVSIYRAEDFIHHLYVDTQQPPQGVGSALLHAAEPIPRMTPIGHAGQALNLRNTRVIKVDEE